MTTNPKIFKAYDLRGIYKKDFDEEFAYNLGLSFVQFIKNKESKDNIKVAIAQDMRLSSPSLAENLIKGIIDAGADVLNLSLASTPTFYFAVSHYNCDGGIIVTASHNPKEYNGFKIVRQKALPVSQKNGLLEIKQLIENNKLEPAETKGQIEIALDVLEKQIEHDKKLAGINNVKPFKVVVDTANGMASLYFDEMFQDLPCKIIRLNWDLDGNFPAHEADPLKNENLKEISEKIIIEKADLGIATDGDGDRIFFLDENGEVIEQGIIRAILAKIFLKEKPGAKIAYDIRPGKITLDTILENGGVPIITKVGHSLIKEKTLEEKAYFAGESSGHFFLNMPGGCYEVPVIIALKLLAELSGSGKTVSEYIKPYKKYFHSGEINSQVASVEEKIKELKEKYQDGKINELDGITVEYPDYWFNVRPSNTEPLLRLNLEAKTKDLMEKKRDEILKMIREK